MMKKILIFISPVLTYFSLFGVSFAATTDYCNAAGMSTLKDLIENFAVGCILNGVIKVIIGMAIIAFLWGVFEFIRSENETKREDGKQFMLWGSIGLFVMMSVWSLVAIFQNTFLLDNTSSIIPNKVTIPTPITTPNLR